MNSKEFLNRVFKSGIASDEEISKYMLKNYFLKGKTFDDFENDLNLISHTNKQYSRALRDSFEDTLKKYSK